MIIESGHNISGERNMRFERKWKRKAKHVLRAKSEVILNMIINVAW